MIKEPISRYAKRCLEASNNFMIGLYLFIILAIFILIVAVIICVVSIISIIGLIALGILLLVGGWVLLLFSLSAIRKSIASSRRIMVFNDLDYKTSEFISTSLRIGLQQFHNINAVSASDIVKYTGLKIGEISRHFDSQTSALFSGWLERKLGISSLKFGLQKGDVSLGFTNVSLGERSTFSQTFSGTSRDNLLADGFVAVFEQYTANGLVDILRTVVPSESALREFLGNYMTDLSKTLGKDTYCEETFLSSISHIQKSFVTDISYVSDRLNAILRLPPPNRPSINIIGTRITDHAIIGNAIYFSDTRQLHYLFPVNLTINISKILKQAEVMRGPLPSPK